MYNICTECGKKFETMNYRIEICDTCYGEMCIRHIKKLEGGE